MSTMTLRGLIHQAGIMTRPKFALWLSAIAGLLTLLILLTLAVDDGRIPSQDRTVLDWVAGRDVPLLGGFMVGISGLTSNYPAFGMGLAGVAFLWLVGNNRAALAFAIVGGVVAAVAVLGDFTLGEFVGRSRPLLQNDENSFPSGHVFGSTVFFGFWGFLAVYYRLKRKLLVPVLVVLFLVILAVGFARMFEQVHWPSDVAAGYLLGGVWLLLLIPFFVYFQRMSWLSSPEDDASSLLGECESCRIERSIASTVVLDPEAGTATKTYRPPGIVRLLYWLAFQAQFPYEHNRAALDTATHRRKIASALTLHRFGKDLVAHVSAVDCGIVQCGFVTDYIAGDKVENDEPTRRFLGEVAKTFAEAGLSVWQVNPRNPHAHTNIIRTPEGDNIIIDLESAVVTPIPAPGQWRSALRRGKVPIFDDIDFERLRSYIAVNETALEESLGSERLAEFRHDVENGEESIRAWQDSEPRIWGHIISGMYTLLDWKRVFVRIKHALEGADHVAEVFLDRGLVRWEAENRLTPSESEWLRSRLSSGEARNALHHLGVHLVLSVVIAIPIPGLRSLARFLWTLAFWFKTQLRRFSREAREARKAGVKASNIHTPAVMFLALLPALGGVAYLASRPLRKRVMVRLMLDQIAVSLPFKLYGRMRLGRWLAPAPRPLA
ncbi:MAG: phosphatase PAP2 family protein [Chloroflexi bacterium]|nr:phosphatase PAP2 family protein [Chloroflexota bacterium]